jgi:hypothetical protein
VQVNRSHMPLSALESADERSSASGYSQLYLACGAGRARFSDCRVSVPGMASGHPAGGLPCPSSRGLVRHVLPSMVVNSTPQWANTVNAERAPTDTESCAEGLLAASDSDAAHPVTTTPSSAKLSTVTAGRWLMDMKSRRAARLRSSIRKTHTHAAVRVRSCPAEQASEFSDVEWERATLSERAARPRRSRARLPVR